MLKAGSLTYTIFVSIIAAVLCSLMIVLAFMNRSYFIQMDGYDKTMDNAQSGIVIGMSLSLQDDYEEWHELYEAEEDSVKIKKRKWGAYEIVFSHAQIGKASYQKTAISGYYSKKSGETALWLADKNRPLQLSGEALLKGNCEIPKKGLGRAYIEGENYSRKELLYGKSSVSANSLLPLENDLKSYWNAYFKKELKSQDSVVDISNMESGLKHSFARKTIVFNSNKAVQVQNVELAGNIILFSEVEIIVGGSAQLNEVILIAPKITVNDNLKGKLHIIARDTLILSEGVQLGYPSSITMINDKGEVPYLKLDYKVKFRGVISSFEQSIRRTNKLAVEVGKEAEVDGMIYSQGNVELNGKVNGLVMCNNFLLTTSSGIYENHILDGKIDRTKLASNFAGIPIKGWNNKSEIIQWLNYQEN